MEPHERIFCSLDQRQQKACSKSFAMLDFETRNDLNVILLMLND
jgi:hypothetical protein